jgi:hypothetical protein
MTGAFTRTGTPKVSARSTSARKSSRSLWSYTAAVIFRRQALRHLTPLEGFAAPRIVCPADFPAELDAQA